MAAPFTALNRVPTPFTNLMVGRPVLATFQVTLRCNSACGYRDLPLNVCRYEMARDEIQRDAGGCAICGRAGILACGGRLSIGGLN